ncbi:MAG: hypothetical protein JSV65_03245 [Armatimonadota bacterium]|nr:MAG: hypothetical protein JSV65_03245 [Armatimonadota bacterium]
MRTTLLFCVWVLPAIIGAAVADDVRNLALGRPYTMSPAPNYRLCTDPEDRTQLTDGEHAGPDMFWAQAAAVGWATSNPIQIIVDLGAVKPVDGVVWSTASRLNAGVHWPTVIAAVSDDGTMYRIVGQMAAAPIANQDPTREYRQAMRLTGLRTRARFVMLFVIPGGPYAFSDEIEVLAGSHEPDRVEMTGRAFRPEEFRSYIGLMRQRAWLPKQCVRLAERARAEAGMAARRGDDGTAAQLRRAEAGLRQLAGHIPALALDARALRDARREVAGLCAEINSSLRPGAPYVVWEHDPWAPLSPLEVPPGDHGGLTRLEVHAAANEYSSAAVTVTNLTRAPMVLTARLEDLRGERATVGADDVCLRRVEFVEAATGELIADALPRLDRRGLRLGAGETSQIWLTLPKRRLPAGDYRGRLLLQPTGADAPRAVTIVLRVYPIELPDDMSLQTYNWAYVRTFPLVRGLEEEAVADLFAHYTNTFVFSGRDVPWPQFDAQDQGTIDFASHDENLELHRSAREISWFWSFHDGERPDAGRFGADYLSPAWKERFAWWLREWVAHLGDLGYGYDDFFMYPFDETLCERFGDLAQFIKEVDPHLRVFADPTSHDTRERIEAIAPYIDVWCPHLFSFEKRADDVELMRAHGEKLWTYACSGPAKALSPHAYYRLMMWKAWRRGFAGCGFWAYADAGWGGSDAWDDFDGTRHDFAVIYAGRNAPPRVPRDEAIIPSKRWEAWREGIEDYELMRAIDEAARRAEANGEADRAASLRASLDNAVEAGLASEDDAGAMESARRRLLKTLATAS